ncbi:MAG: putative two-component sensor kinase [Labilithrix sp.]|nr:putative two-component sensor kinase [Labilithrix sp.]
MEHCRAVFLLRSGVDWNLLVENPRLGPTARGAQPDKDRMTVQPLFEMLDRTPSLVTATDRRGDEEPADGDLHVRTQFLRRVAHDIASPAGVTMTVLEELAAESARPELVAMARRGLRRLLRLSEQLALAADLEAGAITPDPTVEDVRSLVKDALDQAVAIDGRRDIVISCDLPNEKVTADLDRRLVCSALREVIGNALRLASSRVAVNVERAEGKVIIRVNDDGPGFSNEALANLGKRFTPGSSTRGLGLSLSLVKDVLTAHGGDLAVEASSLPPGRRGVRGAAVVVTLPTL